MTQGDFPIWMTYALTAVLTVVLIASERFGARRMRALANWLVPSRFGAVRQLLTVIFLIAYSFAAAIVIMLVAILAVYAIESI